MAVAAASHCKYWVSTVSREHVRMGVQGSFCQMCNGKKGPISRMKEGDWLVYYSPKETFQGKDPCQKFTAIGKIRDNNVYSFKMSEDFVPFRRNVTYLENTREQPIYPLLSRLSFTRDQANWGAKFRFGMFEISKEDFEIIREAMTLSPVKRELAGAENAPGPQLKRGRSALISDSSAVIVHVDPKAIWRLWSDVKNWPRWDHGIKESTLKSGHQFEEGAEVLLTNQGSQDPIAMKITECKTHKNFKTVCQLPLGVVVFDHHIIPKEKGIEIAHHVSFEPLNETTKAIFEQNIWPQIRKGLKEAVANLARLAESDKI